MNKARRSQRKGTTTVEMAFAAPILFLVVFSTIEFWQINTYRNMATEAAYEAARYGVLPGRTAEQIEQRALDAMEKVGATDTFVNVEPATIEIDTEEVTVTVNVPVASNGWVVSKFFAPQTIVRRSTMVRELARFD
jgi:Flp pilus assembly protein TadG